MLIARLLYAASLTPHTRNVVHHNRHVRLLYVVGDDAAVLFLTGGVPELHLNVFAFGVERFGEHVDADRRLELVPLHTV